MISSSLAFNDIEYLSKQLETRNSKTIFDYLYKFETIIDFLHCIKNTIFSVSEYSSFKIDKGDLALSSSEFLTNIPDKKIYTYKNNGLVYTLTYPKLKSGTYKQNLKTCILDINNCKLSSLEIEEVIQKLCITDYKALINFIEKNIISALNKIIIYNTKSEKYRKSFVYNNYSIYELLFCVCKYHLEYLHKIRIIMFKECNFSYREFETMTVEEINKYYKLLKQMYDRSNE